MLHCGTRGSRILTVIQAATAVIQAVTADIQAVIRAVTAATHLRHPGEQNTQLEQVRQGCGAEVMGTRQLRQWENTSDLEIGV